MNEVESDRFRLETESGRRVWVTEFQEMRDATNADTPGPAREYFPGLMRWVDDEGGAVTKRDDGTYLLVQTGEKARRVD